MDNRIGVTLTADETDSDDHDLFADVKAGSIAGTVKDDNGAPLSGHWFYRALKGRGRCHLENTIHDWYWGIPAYVFSDVTPGTYSLFEINPSGYVNDDSDIDNSNDGDASDSNTVVDSIIGLFLAQGEDDVDNDFVDSDNGSISARTVLKEAKGRPLANVVLTTLADSAGVLVATTATDAVWHDNFATAVQSLTNDGAAAANTKVNKDVSCKTINLSLLLQMVSICIAGYSRKS